MNYALEARTQIALYRVLLPLNPTRALAHHDRALEAAASAYDSGQHSSPLLAEEHGLVLEGRWMRERSSPDGLLKTKFTQWLEPLIELAPDLHLQSLAMHFDSMSLADWCNAGDRATVIDSAFQLPLSQMSVTASRIFADVWSDVMIHVRTNVGAFCEAAKCRAELERVCPYVRRYLADGAKTALWAIGERISGIAGHDSYWQSYVFEFAS